MLPKSGHIKNSHYAGLVSLYWIGILWITSTRLSRFVVAFVGLPFVEITPYQLSYAPAHLIPYIEAVPDPLLQSRLFIYPDTQRYRLGVNNQQLPCNAPIVKVSNYQRAGAASYVSQGNRPNYESSVNPLHFAGPVKAIDSQINDNHRQEVFDGTVYRQLTVINPCEIIQFTLKDILIGNFYSWFRTTSQFMASLEGSWEGGFCSERC